MKNILKLLVVAAGIAVLIVGCKKSTTTVPPNGYSSVFSSQQVFDSGKVNFTDVCNIKDTGMFKFGTDTTTYGYHIVTSNGTKFTIPCWAFISDTLSTDSAKKWTYVYHNVCFHYKEFYKTSDFILNNLTTFQDSGNVNLFGHKQWIGQSIGAFEITADDNGSPLYLSRVPTGDSMKRILIQVPTTSSYSNLVNHPLYVYNANYDSLHKIGITYPNINWWVPQQDTSMYSSTNPNFVIYNADSLGWTNFMDTLCLNQMNAAPTTTLTIYTPSSQSFADVQIFFVMGKRIVGKAYPIYPGSTEYQIPNVPVGYSGTIVSWMVSTGNILYYLSQTISPIKPNQTTTLTYTQKTTISSVLDSVRVMDTLYPQ